MSIRAYLYSLILEGIRQRERIFLWLPVAFGAGIAAYFGLGHEPAAYAGVLSVFLLIPFTVRFHRHQHASFSHLFLFLGAAGLLSAALGFCAAQIETARVGTPILEKGIGPADLTGTVESVENLGEGDGSRVVLTSLTLEDLPPEKTPRKVRVKFRKNDGLVAGNTISALVKLDPPSTPVLPSSYDFRRHLFFEGIGGVGFSYSAAKVLDGKPPSGVGLFFERLRTIIDGRIHARAGEVTAGIMSALITGERGAIAKEDDDAMRGSGLYHLLSISGTHVSLVAGILFFFVRFGLALFPWVALHWPLKKIAAASALFGAAFYVFLAGADVPAQRSLMMTGLVMVAIMLDRSPFSLRLIAFSALVVLAIAPHALIGVSFQMSYAAVAGLICFFEYIRPWWMGWRSRAGFIRKSLMYFIGLILTSLIAGTMTGLFSLYHFQSFALYGVISNMMVVPLTGIVIMPAAIVALFLMPFGLEGWAIDAMEWGCVWMLAIAHWTAGLDGAVLHVKQWPAATYGFMVAATILFLLWEGWRGKGIAAVLLVIALILPVFSALPDVMVSGTGKLVALRGADGDLYFSSGRKEKFAAENWLRLSGRNGETPKTFKDEGAPVLCDDQGCRATVKGRNVAIVKNPKAYREDCAWADLMVAEIPLRRKDCVKENVVLGLYEFKDNGAQAIYLEGGQVRVRTVWDDIGERPWTGMGF